MPEHSLGMQKVHQSLFLTYSSKNIFLRPLPSFAKNTFNPQNGNAILSGVNRQRIPKAHAAVLPLASAFWNGLRSQRNGKITNFILKNPAVWHFRRHESSILEMPTWLNFPLVCPSIEGWTWWFCLFSRRRWSLAAWQMPCRLSPWLTDTSA